ncbi:alkaline phosphatase family protein [Portibacter lacus]|uniref:Metalloenzyme domain-containing protein n=1 Tax=Portibacter lacus TaxID=1099794 RepID=A0AA37WCV6_9BACT|nr:phosphoglyceromutase [Portibacter lacus]GLR16991.1 hypothetical protein GCM10007940_16060 [Portibacter lacus]
MKNFFITLLIFTSFSLFAQNDNNVILISLDGLRWQELFGGAADSMILNKNLTHNSNVIDKYQAEDKETARKLLMPWFWSEIATKGQIYGNRWEGNNMNCTNRQWFSYPGYNEILTGYSDPEINSNAKKYNPNKTVLEWVNEQDGFQGKVAAFCSWDVFPYIINDKRSGIYVNAGFQKAEHDELSEKEIFLNKLQTEIPSPWGTVRLDAFTHHYMMEYVKKNHPRLVYISYGETDDFAHDGRYDHYLNSAHQTDQWIKEIWEYVQSDPHYKDNTTLVITTDHGRGHSPMTEWKSHGTIYKGSDQIWAAAIGPNVKAIGEVKSEGQLYQNQIAKTVATFLGLDYKGDRYEEGKAIESMVTNK